MHYRALRVTVEHVRDNESVERPGPGAQPRGDHVVDHSGHAGGVPVPGAGRQLLHEGEAESLLGGGGRGHDIGGRGGAGAVAIAAAAGGELLLLRRRLLPPPPPPPGLLLRRGGGDGGARRGGGGGGGPARRRRSGEEEAGAGSGERGEHLREEGRGGRVVWVSDKAKVRSERNEDGGV